MVIEMNLKEKKRVMKVRVIPLLYNLLRLYLFISFSIPVYSQIGFGTLSPDSSSILHVSSSDKGVLFPRLTNVERDAILDPAEGLTIYNLDEKCLQVNTGTPSSPVWTCSGSPDAGSDPVTVLSDCSSSGFEGFYVNGVSFTSSNKFTLTLTNHTFDSVDISFSAGDLVLSGVGGVSVSSVSPPSASIASGFSQVVEYTLSGTPSSLGDLTGVWTKLGLSCSDSVNVVLDGDALFSFPHFVDVLSVNDGSSDIQGIVDNGSNQFTFKIPYTSGVGTYNAYVGDWIPSNSGTGEGGDDNSFRLTYPGGTFSSSGGVIIATIEVDGDGSFTSKQVLYGIRESISSLDFQVNGNSKGHVHLDITGGILDRNFSDPDHKFVYLPLPETADGKVWLNNNLGANYSNMDTLIDSTFDPSRQATAKVENGNLAYRDHDAYGSLYQWGRFSDGHELIDYSDYSTGEGKYGDTTLQATSPDVGHNKYIKSHNYWLDTQHDSLWHVDLGINNPCPHGYRLPTKAEMDALVSAEGITNMATAADSPLAFSASGSRNFTGGAVLINVGSNGYYWTSSVSGSFSTSRKFSTSTSFNTNFWSGGYGVRCLKD